jgi:hypothetical protein
MGVFLALTEQLVGDIDPDAVSYWRWPVTKAVTQIQLPQARSWTRERGAQENWPVARTPTGWLPAAVPVGIVNSSCRSVAAIDKLL